MRPELVSQWDGYREHPEVRYACPRCAELIYRQAVRQGSSCEGLFFKVYHPARCDSCRTFGDTYAYRATPEGTPKTPQSP